MVCVEIVTVRCGQTVGLLLGGVQNCYVRDVVARGSALTFNIFKVITGWTQRKVQTLLVVISCENVVHF